MTPPVAGVATPVPSHGEHPVPSPTHLPRLLASAATGPALDAHLALHGPLPAFAPASRGSHPLVELIERAGLTGRGGAGFPTARKLAAVARGRGGAVVVANGVEAEPVSAKDTVLCRLAPHLVLDGAQLAAAAVGATRIVVVVHGAVGEVLRDAVAERARCAMDGVSAEILDAATHFVAGEESAVVNWVDRGRSVPTGSDHRPFERGGAGRPTLVNNVETLAHVALIARHGDEWFRSLGTPAEPGTLLVTARGAVSRPGVYEAALGSRLDDVVRAAGGLLAPASAFLVGGYFGTWIDGTTTEVELSRQGLAPLGASVGAGLLLAVPSSCCGVVETARLARYLAGQSAGQCGPCVFGLRAIADELGLLARCGTLPQGTSRLRRWLGEVDGRGACAHPDGVVRLVRSALSVFAGEVERHANGRCSAARPEQSALGLPSVLGA